MAISDIIHYFYFYKKSQPVKVLTPCFYTSLTTSIGFLSLFMSDIKPVSNFGLFGAFAVFISFGSTFLILPYITRAFKIRPKSILKINPFNSFLYVFCNKYKKIILSFFILVTLFLSFQMKNLKFEDNFLNQFKDDHYFSKSVSFFKKNVSFSGTLDLIIFHKREDLLSPEFIKIEREIKKDLLKHPSILNIYSALNIKEDLIKRSNLTDENIKVLDFLLLFEKYIPEGLDESRLVIVLNGQSSKDLSSIFKYVKNVFKKEKYSSKFNYKFSGYSKNRHQMMNFLFKTFYVGIFISLIGIFLSFLFLFKSFKLAILGMIPNVLPVIFVLGVQSLFGIDMNFYLVILNCIVLGISVDDTIHFLYHYKRYNGNLKKFLKVISPPLIMTTILLSILFPVFYFSSFTSFAYISIFLCFSFIVALVADLLLLPTIFLWRESSLIK